MNKTLSLNKLAIDPTAPDAEKEWKFWLLQFQDFVQLTVDPGIDLLKILRLYLTASTFEYVQDCKTYDDAITKLNEVYVKLQNVIFARYEFISRKQRDSESLEEFVHALQRMSKNCEYKNVTAEQYREEMIRDAFINNMSSNEIRTRLLVLSVISLQEAVNNAVALNSAKENAKLYTKSEPIINSVSATDPGIEMTNTSVATKQECYFCGNRRHPRVNCPARNTTCNNCGKVGHFAKVCRSASKRTEFVSVTSLVGSSSSSTATELENAIVEAKINGTNITAQIDTGSSLSFIDERLCKTLQLKLLPADGKVLMASTSFQSRLTGYTIADIELHGFRYSSFKLHILPNASSLQRVLQMFAAYFQWIPRFSEKIYALARCTTFPLPQPAVDAFEALKKDIVNSVVIAIDDELPFTVETDASDYAIAATLSQLVKPVAFFSRVLSNSEQRHSSVEKEAYAIVEAIRKWRHYLLGHHFHVITDQRSVAFMFNNKQAGKAKNDKIMRVYL
ncbi:Retrovirus-related Pol polyprotein from transposon 17.6 [Trichinella sp. T8]|nr:Retrovirus-related Pol polyprotein from transposon 17.6 [Trichinella sp. T8]